MSGRATTCPYCGVGCGITAELAGERLIAVSGDSAHPANRGRLCVKGTALAETLVSQGRLLYPSYRGRRLPWDGALGLVARQIEQVRANHGPGALGFYLSGQLLTEDYYVANKLMKGFLGSANVDTNSRLCMSSAVAGYQRAFGADFVPCSYADLEECELLVMVGSNAAWTHPVLYQRIAESRRANPHKRIVVIDPRHTATCDIADIHLQIAPGSDGFLFAGLLRYLGSSGQLDESYVARYTEGLRGALAVAAPCTLEMVSRQTGLEVSRLEAFYRLFAATEKTVTFYSQGINQSATGTDKCNAIVNCHLATGRLGRPGTGPFSITGQPNAMGGREVGGMANHLAAHMDFRPEHVALVRRFWRAPDIATAPGLKAVDLFRAAAEGEIRFLWIMATNPVVSLPDSALVRAALARCEFVVVSDCAADTDTAACADLLLPAAGWGEKDGTVTNSERCISRQRRLVPAPGEARPDWWMVAEVARRLGFGEAFDYRGPANIFAEHARLSGFENGGSRDFDISALAGLERSGYEELPPTYWPCPAVPAASPVRERFFTPSGRARFVAATPTLPGGGAAAAPLLLNTGRLRDQWHTMTRTGRVPRLMRHRDFYGISMHAADARDRDLAEGDLVELSGERGSVRALLRLDGDVAPGQVFSPIHWSGPFSGRARIGELLAAVTDPVSGQPQSKYARVAVAPVAVSCWGFLVSRDIHELPELAYWSRVAITGGHLTLLAAPAAVAPAAIREAILAALPVPGLRQVSYEDAASGDYRDLFLSGQEPGVALFLHRERRQLPAMDWLGGILRNAEPVAPTAVLAGAGGAAAVDDRQVCTCCEVGEKQICAAIAAGAGTVEALGARLRCGTQCGSCVPEIRRLLAVTGESEDAA